MDIRNRYVRTFFKDINKERKRIIRFKQYMWHVFSFDLIQNYKEKQEAVDFFKQNKENDVYIFFQRNDKVISKKNITYEEIIDNIFEKNKWDSDCYIVDKDFTWTFIITHEMWASKCYEMSKEEYLQKYKSLPKELEGQYIYCMDEENQDMIYCIDEEEKDFYIGPYYYQI